RSATTCFGLPLVCCGYIVQQSGWPSALGANCPHRSVPAMTPEARRRRLRGRGPVGCRCYPGPTGQNGRPVVGHDVVPMRKGQVIDLAFLVEVGGLELPFGLRRG